MGLQNLQIKLKIDHQKQKKFKAKNHKLITLYQVLKIHLKTNKDIQKRNNQEIFKRLLLRLQILLIENKKDLFIKEIH